MTNSDSASAASSYLQSMAESTLALKEEQTNRPAFSFYPLRKLSARLFSRQERGTTTSLRPGIISRESSVLRNGGKILDDVKDSNELGMPTVMDVRGMIAVGTELGLVSVHGFGQDLRCILGAEDLGEC